MGYPLNQNFSGADDIVGLLVVMQQGLDSPEHQAFVEHL